MNRATIPDQEPSLESGKPFVPRVVVIEFDHPKHGPGSWFSAEDNSMNDNIMLWCSWDTGMEAYSEQDGLHQVRTIIKNVRKKHPEAKVTSNWHRWR